MKHIFLYGPSGTGKSTVGKILAEHLQFPFVDLDAVIEQSAGKSIPQIMSEQGEQIFRDIETSVLKSLASEKQSVVALGGGALLRDGNHKFAMEHGKVILLMAEVETLITRLASDTNKRPLLAGDLREKLSTLLLKRSEHYSSFHNLVDVDNKSEEDVAFQVQVMIGRHHLSAMGEYDVIVGQLSELENLSPNNTFLVTDENVAKHHLDSIKQAIGSSVKTLVIPAGEEYKNLESISRLWQSFLDNGLDRKSTVIAMGGGVICDMTGFAASTYMRGIDWVAVPTTLLAMVDASIGGKTGFDLREGKNLIGSFHPPKLVLADPSLLLTLPKRELISGMAEVVKHGVISDPDLFQLCERNIDWVMDNLEDVVKRAMAVKIKTIESDPYEQGLRASLNYGHTVGHAVELVSRFHLSHGEAISNGMVVEAKYAEKIGLASTGLADVIGGTLSSLGLPVEIPKDMPRDEIIRVMRVDKKKSAKAIRFALPAEIGRVELVEVSDLGAVISE